MKRLCDIAIPGCRSPFVPGLTDEADSPITNLSSEAPDGLSFRSIVYPPYDPDRSLPPDAGSPEWWVKDCNDVAISFASKELADLAAKLYAQICDDPTVETGTKTQFSNEQQIASANCPDGSLFWYRVPAGTFVSPLLSQEAGQAWLEAANAMALAYAQQQVANVAQRSCLNCPRLQGSPGWVCLQDELDPIANTYTLTGANAAADYNFEIVAGSLPPGTSLVKISHNSAQLVGFPSATGTYSYTVRATRIDFTSIFAEVTDTLRVFGITNPTCDDATSGQTGYSFQLLTGGGNGTVHFTFIGGNLPPNLGLSINGLISGDVV